MAKRKKTLETLGRNTMGGQLLTRVTALEAQVKAFVENGVHQLPAQFDRFKDEVADVTGSMSRTVRMLKESYKDVRYRCESCGRLNTIPELLLQYIDKVSCTRCASVQRDDFVKLLRARTSGSGATASDDGVDMSMPTAGAPYRAGENLHAGDFVKINLATGEVSRA